MSFALLNLPDTYVLEFFVWHDLTDHRRIQEAGVLSVIERSGGLFGQVLKMEETPKWHKMTIVNPKKNRNTFFTNLHYLCWDLPFFNLLGMTTAAARSSLWPGYSAGPFWENLGWEKPWENRGIGGALKMGQIWYKGVRGRNSCWLLKEGSKHAGGFHYFHVAGSRCTSDVIRICFDDLWCQKCTIRVCWSSHTCALKRISEAECHL